NLLESEEFEEVKSHVIKCCDCEWDVINFEVVKRLEDLDRRGELPDWDNEEVERLLKIIPLAPITKNLSTRQPQISTGSKNFSENFEIDVRNSSDKDTRQNETIACRSNFKPTNAQNKLAG
ncbi:MAG: hypothetical protein LBT09_11855, partial [Planctomycetaceae bacterium]|nr:hypothetical protein [Planctomycetaceae bacterium]